MVYITWYNQHHQSWVHDDYFDSFGDAEDYLKECGYELKNGWYTRNAIGWEGTTKAIVSRLMPHKKKIKE